MRFISAPLALTLAVASIAALSSRARADEPPAAGPGYSKIVTTLESQPVQGAQLLYFDQSTADALGLKLPPGRIGIPDFEQAVLKKLAFEIKQGTKKISAPAANRDAQSNPYIFVEDDAFGGSGRAGYIEADPGVWVNIKGIGLTGAGRVSNVVAGPPSNVFKSHHDGSATLEESIKETVYSRVSDEELAQGGNRVLAVVYTGRTLRYPDGREVPLALIVRAPLERFDQGGDAEKAVESLAGANAKRIMKGDFVNESNLGVDGEWVDFGVMSFTDGYAPLVSSQHENFLFEGQRFLDDRPLYLQTLGKGLIEQMGIPESQLEKAVQSGGITAGELQDIGNSFAESVYWAKGKPGATATPTLLDFKPVSLEQLQGNVKFQEFFRDAAKNYFDAPAGQKTQIFQSETNRLLSLTGEHDDTLVARLSEFLKNTQDVFEKVADANSIGQSGSALTRSSYADKLGQIASFKNRDITDLVRPTLFNNSGSLADQFVRDHNAQAIDTFIENTVLGNRFETTPDADSNLIASADQKFTRLYVRAYLDPGSSSGFGSSGVTQKLYQYPDLPGAGPGENFGFRISTDGWKTQKDFIAKYTDTKVGGYFEIDIPNGSMPVTESQVELVPFVRDGSGNVRWLANNLNLRGPPMVFNERLGLPASFARQEGVMRDVFKVMTSINPDDVVPYGSSCDRFLLAK